MGLEKVVWLAKLQNVKCTVLLLFVLNGTVFGLALWLVLIQNSWSEQVLVVIGILVAISGFRVFWLGAMGFAQVAVASVMITAQQEKDAQAAAAAADDDDDDDDDATQDGSLTLRDRRVCISSFSIYTHIFTKLLGLVALLTSFCCPFSTYIHIGFPFSASPSSPQEGQWRNSPMKYFPLLGMDSSIDAMPCFTSRRPNFT
jgi:hypothetical protein